jgi:hypothetical protein
MTVSQVVSSMLDLQANTYTGLVPIGFTTHQKQNMPCAQDTRRTIRILCLTGQTQVVNDPLDALNAIWDAAITQGDQVKAQIGTTVGSFRGSTDSIKKNIVDNLAMAERDYKPLTTQYDGYRYSVSGLTVHCSGQ